MEFFHAGLLDERTTEEHYICGGEAPATADSPSLSTCGLSTEHVGKCHLRFIKYL